MYEFVSSWVDFNHSAKGPYGWDGCILLQQHHVSYRYVPGWMSPFVVAVEDRKVIRRPSLSKSPHDVLAQVPPT